MLRMRGSFHSYFRIAALAFICLCVVMQMLGTTMTLWDLEFSLDPVNASLLEGFSLPVDFTELPPLAMVASLFYTARELRALLQDRTFFRPPIPNA